MSGLPIADILRRRRGAETYLFDCLLGAHAACPGDRAWMLADEGEGETMVVACDCACHG